MPERSLIECLLDANEDVATRHDAALDLADYPTRAAEKTLIKIATDPRQDEILQDGAAEALKEIWNSQDVFHMDVYQRFTPMAQHIMKPYLIQYQQTHADQ